MTDLLSTKYKVNYTYFEENRYSIPEFTYLTTEYNAICNNCFIKLRTVKGNNYWLNQNTHEHLSPDWKFHFSISEDDIKKAWDILSHLYIKHQCWEGMKVIYLKEGKVEKGREITIYLYSHSNEYEFDLTKSDERAEGFWISFISQCEQALEDSNIKANGCADGDLPLGKYCSLRNESYAMHEGSYIYPLNEDGWNAANHKVPFNIKRFKLALNRKRKEYSIFKLISLIILSVSIVFFLYFQS